MNLEPAFKLLNCRSVIRTPQVGERCWTCDIFPYELKDGLGNREEVLVLKHELTKGAVTVRAGDGRVHELSKINLDAGMMYLIDEEWVRESEPRVLDALEVQLKRLPESIHPSMREYLPEILDEIQWKLQRWGRSS